MIVAALMTGHAHHDSIEEQKRVPLDPLHAHCRRKAADSMGQPTCSGDFYLCGRGTPPWPARSSRLCRGSTPELQLLASRTRARRDAQGEVSGAH